mgnify:CR=1 FL=1
MNILNVIPLTAIPRGQPQLLSYFSSQPVAKGGVVMIPLNRREVKGIVVGGSDLQKNKLLLKKAADYELKNVIKIISAAPLVANWQLAIAEFLSNYYFAPLGLCLKTVLPPFWGKKKYQSKITNVALSYICRIRQHFGLWGKLAPPTKFTRTNLVNHHLDYQRDIETTIKEEKQVFLMAAEKIAVGYFIEKFKNLDPVYISSGLPNRDCHVVWQDAASGKKKLIIGTRVGLFLPFNNLGLIIVDDESNEAYKSDMTPRYHAADLAAEIAKVRGAKLILNSIAPRLETYHNLELGTHNSKSAIQRLLTPKSFATGQATHYKLQTSLVSMVDELRAGNFSIFSRELQDVFLKIENLKLKIILYIPRRGHANFILCQTCGQPLTCPNCSASLVPHTLEAGSQRLEARIVCHHCDHIQPQPKQCPACGGYQLKAYGIGLEKVIAELKKFFQYQNIKLPEILRLDSDWVRTEAEEEKVVSSFQGNQGAIMVATQMIFSHKRLISAPIVGIINADTLINIPDFRAEESLFRQIYILGQMAERLIIQTHNPDDPAIKFAARGELKKFFEDELASRREFSYPPHSRLIKLTYRHQNPAKAQREATILAERLKQSSSLWPPASGLQLFGPAPAFIFKERGLYHWLIILKLNQNLEIKTRNELLRVVPSGWAIDIDPKNII